MLYPIVLERLLAYDASTDVGSVYNTAGVNLGKTYSLVMCVLLECDIIMSDDDSVKMRKVVEDKFSFNIDVLDRDMLCKREKELCKSGLNKKPKKQLLIRVDM